MKIRNGFVSNSSSSSFIVAFPRKPQTASDVFKFMFNNEEYEISGYCGDKLCTKDIANKVFDDIICNKIQRGTLSNIAKLLQGEYYSIAHDYQQPSKYCGSDTELLNKYIEITKESNKKLEELCNQRDNIKKKQFKEPYVSYACKNNKFSKKQVEEYEEYKEKYEKFINTNKDYVIAEKKIWDCYREYDKKLDIIGKKLSKIDTKKFMYDNKGKFIFTVTYSDSEGELVMEHGGIFATVPHIYIDQH